MIPIHLTLKDFLSYRDKTEIDFTGLDVACISGPNGAGKSSLFDAITWVLFGKARRNDDEALINSDKDTVSCQVVLDFEYENNRYRVDRIKEKGKSTQLEFQMLASEDKWKVLTEAGLRSTEERIRDVLHLDYETFINSSFFLQGKADLFAQQTPAKRKEILSSILGLEVWESYRDESARRRRSSQEDLKVQRQILDDIQAELGQEAERIERLNLLSQNLDKTTALLKVKEKEKNLALAEHQTAKAESDKLEIITSQLNANQKRLKSIQNQIAERQTELKEQEALLKKEKEIQKAYQSWQKLRLELEEWNKMADEYHQMQGDRAEIDTQIQSEEARLHQEKKNLQEVQQEINKIQISLPSFLNDLDKDKNKLSKIEESLIDLPKMEEDLSHLQAASSELIAENRGLKEKLDEIKINKEILTKSKGSQCPLCGLDLSESHRKQVLDKFDKQEKILFEKHQDNARKFEAKTNELRGLRDSVQNLRKTQTELTSLQRVIGQKDQRASDAQTRLEKWQREQEPRLKEIRTLLKEKTFSKPVRVQLQEVESTIDKLGYNPEEHNRCRQEERDARAVEETYRNLEKARTAVESLHRELSTLQDSQQELQDEVNDQTALEEGLRKKLQDQQKDLADIQEIEAELEKQRNEANSLRQQVGAAQQMVDVLEKQRKRQKDINIQIKDIQQKIANLKMLETAFGRDGIPALLIEQSLPEIETQANDILDRLTSGRMSITFETEREYKDKSREDKKQTLDILIRDASGHQREYELFSGGEAFRINFSIRLALSRVLAQRAGARLQTLVIDEGFGSQDAEGRQRLIEAINLISQDFAKILVITHLDEMKDAFPSRIEVQKTQRGSKVEVIP